MKNPKIERLETRLKLWETPGFSGFLQDLIDYTEPSCPLRNNIDAVKRIYQVHLQELKDKEGKFKQGKLEL